MKKHNFYAGPSILSQYTLDKCVDAIRDFAGTGLSILEISHRSKEFQAVVDEAEALFKELLDIPEGYKVLFLGGGASTQFYMVPANLLKTKAAYLDTGTWANKAIKEAKLFGEVNVVGSSKEDNYTYIPKGYEIPTDVDYFHITPICRLTSSHVPLTCRSMTSSTVVHRRTSLPPALPSLSLRKTSWARLTACCPR